MSLLAELAHLDASGLLRLVQIEPHGEYEFKHTLYRDSAYALLLRQDRKNLHGLVGMALERRFPDRLREFAPRLAEHFRQAGNRDAAAKYAGLAGEESLRVHAYGEAVTYFERALDIRKDEPIRSDQLCDAYRDLGRALELSGQFERALGIYWDMREHGAKLRDPRMELAAMTLEATLYCTSSPLMDRARGRQLSLSSLAAARDLGEVEQEIRSRWNLLLSLGSIVGQEQEALRHGEQALLLASENNLDELGAFLRNDLGRVHLFCCNLNKSEQLLRQAEQEWRRRQNWPMLVDCLTTLTLQSHYVGKYAAVPALTQEAQSLAEETGNPWARAYSVMMVHQYFLETGQFGTALESAQTALDRGVAINFLAGEAIAKIGLAMIYKEVGAWQMALEVIEGPSRQLGSRGHPFADQARGIEAGIHLRRGELESARKSLAQVKRSQEDSSSECFPIAAIPIDFVGIELALASGDFQSGLQQALSLEDQLSTRGARCWLVDMFVLKAEAHLSLGNPLRAIENLREAKDLAESMGARRALRSILTTLARAEEQAGNHHVVGGLLRQAGALVGELADSLGNRSELRASFLARPEVQKVLQAAP